MIKYLKIRRDIKDWLESLFTFHMYIRPDIAYAIGAASQFMYSPSKKYTYLVMRIVRYLKGSPRSGILFRSHGHLDIMKYSDVD
jgi:hypothetical protein